MTKIFLKLLLSAVVAAGFCPALVAGVEGDRKAIEACLAAWGDHPFSKGDKTPYRVIENTVKVLGIGGEISDQSKSSEPKLVLVRPAVQVLTSNHIRLLDPNAWYCVKANVTVLAKAVIELGCTSRLADSKGDVAVLGKNEKGTGVTVLGSARVERKGCG